MVTAAGGQTGGMNPLYQIGGPRSAQLALKLQSSGKKTRPKVVCAPPTHRMY
jgi:hypothetical protein